MQKNKTSQGKQIEVWSNALGFEYHKCQNKTDFENCLDILTAPQQRNCPLLLECTTAAQDDVDAFEKLRFLEDSSKLGHIKDSIKKVIGPKGTELMKKILHR